MTFTVTLIKMHLFSQQLVKILAFIIAGDERLDAELRPKPGQVASLKIFAHSRQGQCTRFPCLSHQRASNEPSLLVYTKYGCRLRFRTK